MKALEHIAFIMDGNRRWADAHGYPRVRGHKEGILTIERVVEGCINNNIEFVTFFAFSTENWSRERAELRYLSRLMYRYLWLLKEGRVGNDLLKKIRIQFIGDTKNFGERNFDMIDQIELITKNNKLCRVIVAISYGGRDEIIHAVNKSLQSGIKHISKKDIEDHLYIPGMPFPDMIVRTADEYRLSNFLMWQSAYSEFLFVKKFWPDMQAADIGEFAKIYKSRDRKFGS